eukprot:GHVU01130232.1.p1 GENE.GHVU01130232.1~~GHVU01130232.1.p1  ORF type:complete len:107 (+),score=6.85 GHVU01130232.1:785-1105(+)
MTQQQSLRWQSSSHLSITTCTLPVHKTNTHPTGRPVSRHEGDAEPQRMRRCPHRLPCRSADHPTNPPDDLLTRPLSQSVSQPSTPQISASAFPSAVQLVERVSQPP